MNLAILKSDLAKTIVQVKQIRMVIEATTQNGRQLIDEEDVHEIQNTLLTISSDIATAESNMGAYGRMTPYSKKFVNIK